MTLDIISDRRGVSPVVGIILIAAIFIIALTVFTTFFAGSDIYVVDQMPEEEYDGSARSMDTLDFPLKGIVGSVIEDEDNRIYSQSMWGVESNSAFEYEGTVYILDSGPMYYKVGGLELHLFPSDPDPVLVVS